jgi:hypothetical protein
MRCLFWGCRQHADPEGADIGIGGRDEVIEHYSAGDSTSRSYCNR